MDWKVSRRHKNSTLTKKINIECLPPLKDRSRLFTFLISWQELSSVQVIIEWLTHRICCLEMKLLIFLFVLIELVYVLYCDDYKQFNTTFSNLNVTYFNGRVKRSLNILNLMMYCLDTYMCSVVVDSSENETFNGTHRITSKNYTFIALWTFISNLTSNWTKTSSWWLISFA